ncbi:MAG: glycosyl transferase family 2 [Coriobacteriaceae bacterium]|nr:glycosyl transferase family 2 [Coriobacteriaceae bacterium]
MWHIELTWLNGLVATVVVYYMFLFVHLVLRRMFGPNVRDTGYRPFVFVVVPAHNEEDVIAHTIESLLRQEYPHRTVLIMNDGSQDATSRIAHEYADAHSEVLVVDRGADVAGRGKGAVLNHACEVILDMVAQRHPILEGRGPEDVLICIVDADGQLEAQTLSAVSPYFAEPDVGGVQIGVRIANANTNILTLMQDIEFVGFSAFVQEARDAFGSVGLGGNGQFTRLSALLSLGHAPWTECLTEDLDLGLSLVGEGWRIRFCPRAYVAQQAVTGLKALFRQRTRWIQGHYQCWRHLPVLNRRHRVPLRTRIDLSLYLVLVVFVVLVTIGMFFSILSFVGLATLHSSLLVWLPPGVVRNLVTLVLSFGPLWVFLLTYQMRAQVPLPARWLPAYSIIFACYTYCWFVATVWAWTRMALRRGSWSKTRRVKSEAAV